jgi:hypothetical protein
MKDQFFLIKYVMLQRKGKPLMKEMLFWINENVERIFLMLFYKLGIVLFWIKDFYRYTAIRNLNNEHYMTNPRL